MSKDRANKFAEEYEQVDESDVQQEYEEYDEGIEEEAEEEFDGEYAEAEEAEDEYAESEDDEEEEASYGSDDEDEYFEEESEEENEEEYGENEDQDHADDGIDLDELENFAQLLGYLEQELTRYASTMLLSSKKLVDTDKCLRIIENMKEALPDTVKYCWKIYEERDNYLKRCNTFASTRVEKAKKDAQAMVESAKAEEEEILSAAQRRSKNIIADAQARANAILKEATARAQRMVDESEIMKHANRVANLRIENAREEARKRRMSALHDGYRLYEALERQTVGITEAISRKKEEMRLLNLEEESNE